MSLFVKCICPSCFNEIYLGDCGIISGRTTGKPLKTPSKGMFARMNVEPLEGPYYTLELARRECTECKYLLPPNIERVPSITLVVVGDVSSGKSHYIAALIQQIRTEWIRNPNPNVYTTFESLTPEVEKQFTSNYYEPLFTYQQAIAPTQPATSPYANPLIYKLTVSPSPKHPTTAVNLMIYDTSGEDFEAEVRIVNFARFVLNTNAFIFVVNPLVMAPVFNQLDPTLQANLSQQYVMAQRRRAAARLNAIISIYKRYHGHLEGSHLPGLPISVMVSKSDLLGPLISSKHTIMTQPNYEDGLDLYDIEAVNQEVRELLHKYKQSDLLAATSRFEKVKFFASTATGEPPDATGHFNRVEPRRCLDPVLWILHQLGMIKESR